MLLEGAGGKYVVVFDPLDGSSNIDASIPTGTLLREALNAEISHALVASPLDILPVCVRVYFFVSWGCVGCGNSSLIPAPN